ncbi:MAG: AbrB/MazE/SpoVT family DNA-binding domain-containing protein [Roseitalea sp.]|nr:AbrB/MazE/SpoVT family DNA-binding domain-containing protein [Roseitalea sp.]MBO6721229.1 AbrB/MazE/SpoVT family DNA-binding domain-containing protein [Roseitalea sp.]MBO6742287.1 AbrB/MazE/SpoVT family DNA-binding domain-containing protein [Roseitalea sp.]
MTRVQISKWGNSSAIRLPKAVLEQLGLKAGDAVTVAVEGGKAVIEPARAGKVYIPPIEELIAEADRIGWDKEPETIDWGPDVGSEIIDDDDNSYR